MENKISGIIAHADPGNAMICSDLGCVQKLFTFGYFLYTQYYQMCKFIDLLHFNLDLFKELLL